MAVSLRKHRLQQWLAACFLLAISLTLCQTADPTISTQTLTDSAGNTADNSSSITWAPIPAGSPYNGSSSTYDDKGMGTLYDMAKNFVAICLFPSGYPSVLICELSQGFDFSKITNNLSQYVTPIIGYGICIAVGVLFIVIFPVVGICFCCCRCCGNCGGRRIQDEEDAENNCKRNTYSIVLLILVGFTFTGAICNYVCNENISVALKNFGTTAKTNAMDMKTFLDNLQLQMTYIAKTNFNFTTDVLYRDLESMGYLVGVPVRSKLKTEGGVDAAFNSVLNLQGNIDNLTTSLNKVNTSLSDLKTSISGLSASLLDLKTDIEAIKTGGSCTSCGALDTSTLDTTIDSSQFPDISSQVSDINAVKDNDLTATVDSAQKDFEDVPWRVQNETATVVSNVKNQVSSFSGDIDPMLDQVDTLAGGDMNTQINSFVDQLNGYTDMAATYDKYRWYGGVGLASIILIICLLQFLGLVFGVCGHEKSARPTQRNCISNCGGNCLMASVVLIFLFSSLLTLLTLVLYTVGAPLERLLCNPISDPDFVVFDSTFNQLLDDQMGGGESFLGKTLFQNGSVDIKLTDILRNCRANQGAYKALKLNKLIDFDEIADVRSKVDIDSNLDLSTIDMSSTKVVTPDLSDQLQKLKDSSDINYADFRSELSNNPTGADLSNLAASLRAAKAGQTAGDQNDLEAAAVKAERIETEDVVYVNGNKTKLSDDLDGMEVVTNKIPTAVDAVNTSLYSLQDYLQNNGTSVIEAEAKTFADRLFSILDSFIDDTKSALDDEIGVCTPIWNLYNTILVEALCRYTVDSLSGFWFTLGWCVFFFVPSTIFSVKLAKHFRTMQETPYLDNIVHPEEKNPAHPMPGPVADPDDLPPPYDPRNIAPSPVFRSNKVGHADGW